MRTLATLVLSVFLSLPASAAVIHDESIDGDLSTDPAHPTALVFAPGGNTIIGSMGAPADIRDYITFSIPDGQLLTHLNLLAYAPDNLGFTAFNAGATSFIPSAATDAQFLAGIHLSGEQVGSDLMPLYVSDAVTANSLPAPNLGPGTYCFVIQQTSPITTIYSLEFVIDGGVPTARATWGTLKKLYR